MRPIVMRPIILAVSVLAAAFSGQVSPTSPTSPALAHSRNATQLPFGGTFTAADQGVVVPPSLLVQGTGEGTATQLGHFTMTSRRRRGSGDADGDRHLRLRRGERRPAAYHVCWHCCCRPGPNSRELH